MTKTRTSNKKKNAKPVKSKVYMQKISALDAVAAKWAALLNDPCNGVLSHPIYPGAEGGALVRVESEATFFSSATDVCGMVAWVPGHPGTDCLGQTGGVNPGTAIALNDAATLSPGYIFLRTNASSARCVAACAQLYWPGSELNRQGFVAGGQISGGTYLDARQGAVMSPDTLRTLCATRTRMPDGCLEIKWLPTINDAQWIDPSEATTIGAAFNSKTALAFSVSGIPVSTGVRVRFVAVYEYLPKFNLGVAQPYNSRALSRSSLDDVINYLDKNMPHWRARIMAMGANLGYNIFTRMRGNQARIEL